MSCIFTKGATVVTITRGPLFPYSPVFDPAQVSTKTFGGTLVTQDLGASEDLYVFAFRNLTTTQKTNLYNFYKTTMNRAADTFTFTDPAAAEHTARWMDSTFRATQTGQDRWSLTVTLRYE